MSSQEPIAIGQDATLRRADHRVNTRDQTVAFLLLFAATSAVGVSPMQASYVLALACWLATIAITRGREGWRPNPLLTPLLALAVAGAIAAALSIDPGQSFKGVKQLGMIALILVVGNSLRSRREVMALVLTWLAGATVVSLYAVCQYIQGAERVHAFFDGPMTLVRILVLVTALGIAVFVTARGRVRLVALACLVSTVPALLLTFSRAGWLTLCVVAFFVGILRRSRIVLGGAALAVCLAVGCAVAYPQTTTGSLLRSIVRPMDPALHRFGESTFQRVWMYRAAWQVFLDHPVAGVGQRNFGNVYGRHIPEELRNPDTHLDEGTVYTGFSHAHSLYLNLLATQGLLGLAAFLWLIVAAVRLAWRNWRRAQDEFLRAVSLGILAAIVAFLTMGLIDENSRDSESIAQLWFLLGLAAALHRIIPTDPPAPVTQEADGLTDATPMGTHA